MLSKGDDMKIGFLGLGNMGGPMALNVVKKAGMPVVVFDPRPDAMEKLTQAGAQAATSPRDVANQAEIVFEIGRAHV